MQKNTPQHADVIGEVERLKHFFRTTPILIKEWHENGMVVHDIPAFVEAELRAALTFNPTHYFNPPLLRLQLLEQAIRKQTGSDFEGQ
ncbi:MAG: hypothetical protein QM642_06190 [Edaphocola sp.]